MSNSRLLELIAQKQRELAAQKAALTLKPVAQVIAKQESFGENPDPADEQPTPTPTNGTGVHFTAHNNLKHPASINFPIEFNDDQILARDTALNLPPNGEMCIIGAAGTGKTTVIKEIIREAFARGLIGRYNYEHKYLPMGGPAIAFVSFTNRAVRNMRRVLPKELADNCCTIHALLEYYFEFYEEMNEEGNLVGKRRAVPKRGKNYKLTGLQYLVVDESSMVGLDLHDNLKAALPDGVRIIYLGDLNQLPPIYSSAILGYKLCDDKVKTVELKKVYRQALDNPILAFAHRILAADDSYTPEAIRSGSKNKEPALNFRAFKKRVDWEWATPNIGTFFQSAIDGGLYDPEEDCILIPFNKKFGTIELNKYVAQKLAEIRNEEVHEVISGFMKHYFAVGDRVIFGKYEGKIVQIVRNGKYFGPQPRIASTLMNRWGMMRAPKTDKDLKAIDEAINGTVGIEKGSLANMQLDEVDLMLSQTEGKKEDAKRAASHIVTLELAETGERVDLDEAGEINSILFGYVLTVHKAQGAEWRRVFFILHNSHAVMMNRELLYTGVTRAREELVILCDADSIEKSIARQKIKGSTLREKAEFFKGKQDASANAKSITFNPNDED